MFTPWKCFVFIFAFAERIIQTFVYGIAAIYLNKKPIRFNSLHHKMFKLSRLQILNTFFLWVIKTYSVYINGAESQICLKVSDLMTTKRLHSIFFFSVNHNLITTFIKVSWINNNKSWYFDFVLYDMLYTLTNTLCCIYDSP